MNARALLPSSSLASLVSVLVALGGCSAAVGGGTVTGEPSGAPTTAGTSPVAPAPSGTAPTSSKPPQAPGITLAAATDDGAIVFQRNAGGASSLEVFDPSTGATTVLAATFHAADRMIVAGNLVAFWTAVSANGAGTGELGLWSRAGGIKRVASGSTASVFAATSDGATIAYTANAASGGGSDLFVGAASLVPAPTAVVQGVVGGAAGTACEMHVGFVAHRLFAATCAAGDTAPTVRTASEALNVTTILASATRDWSANATGSKVFVISSTGVGSVHTVSGNHATVIDQGVTWGELSEDGSAVFYRTSAGVLTEAPTAPTTGEQSQIIGTGIRGVDAFSPGHLFALVSANVPDTTNRFLPRQDVQLRPIKPGMEFIPTPTDPTYLVPTRTGFAVGFTTEGDKAIYLSSIPATGVPAGTLMSHALDLTGAEVVLAQSALTPKLLGGGTRSTRVVFADHARVGADGSTPTAVDVKVVDTATVATTLVKAAVDPVFLVTGSQLVFTQGGRGIFTAPLP